MRGINIVMAKMSSTIKVCVNNLGDLFKLVVAIDPVAAVSVTVSV